MLDVCAGQQGHHRRPVSSFAVDFMTVVEGVMLNALGLSATSDGLTMCVAQNSASPIKISLIDESLRLQHIANFETPR